MSCKDPHCHTHPALGGDPHLLWGGRVNPAVLGAHSLSGYCLLLGLQLGPK